MKAKPLLFDRIMALGRFENPTVPFVIDPMTVASVKDLVLLPDLPERAIMPYPHIWLEFPDNVGALVVATELTIVVSAFADAWPDMPVISMAFRTGKDPIASGYIPEVVNPLHVRPFEEPFGWVMLTQMIGSEKAPWQNRAGVYLFEGRVAEYGEDKARFMALKSISSRFKGLLGLSLATLAAMAFRPEGREVVTPPGRWLAKRRHGYQSRPFASHTVVRIDMAPRLLYQRAVDASREPIHKREHDVRSHPRVLHRGTAYERTVIVKSHTRGVPALGQIIHDAYETTRTERL
jgi:hypothetical protein